MAAGNDAAARSRSQPAAQPTGRDGDRPRPPQVSHPAALAALNFSSPIPIDGAPRD